MRVSPPTDLIIQVTAECAIFTALTTTGNDTAQAFGEVKVWVELDGTHVPVATADLDEGRVVFCNRRYHRTTTLFDDEDATIESFIDTRTANGFNWLALNAGSYDDPANGFGIIDVAVKATLTEGTMGDATAEAVVGNRTVIVEPTKASNHETL